MSELIRKAIEKSLLFKKKPHLAPKASPVADPANWEDAKSKLREILRANGGKPGPWLDGNGQMRLLGAKLRLKELAARSVEFAMVSSTKFSKLGDAEMRKKFVKSLRRHLEKHSKTPEDRSAIRSALGARPMLGEITTKVDAEVSSRRAFLDRAARKKHNADIAEAGFSGRLKLKLIPEYRDPDFKAKSDRLNKIRALADRASKNKKYQKLTGNQPGYVNSTLPKVVGLGPEGAVEPAILTYRGINDTGGLKQLRFKLRRPRDGAGKPDARTPVRHTLRAHGGLASQPGMPSGAAMSMSTNPKLAESFAKPGSTEHATVDEGAIGVYAIPVKKLIRSAREGTLGRGTKDSKIGMVNSTFPNEREISQSSGGNLVSVRKYKYPEEGNRARAFSRPILSRLHELALIR